MSRVILIPPETPITDEIVTHLKEEGGDYSSWLVIFPGRRPSHFLRKTIGKRFKNSFIPPRIFSMDDFVDYLYEEHLGLERPKIDRLDAIAILYDLHKEAINPLGSESFMSSESFLPLGMKIFRDIEEFYIESIPPEKVREIDHLADEQIPEKALKNLQSISFFYDIFYKKIERMALSTRSLRYRTVSEKIDEAKIQNPKPVPIQVKESKIRNIIFAGFFALTKSEKILFKRLSGSEHCTFIFQRAIGIEEKLAELAFIPEFNEPKSIYHYQPITHFYKSPDTHGQVFALSRKVREYIKENVPLDENMVFVLPSSETLFPLLHHCLSLMTHNSSRKTRCNELFNISLGYPLYRTPVFSFFNSLMGVITSMEEDRYYMPDYIRFVLHPYTKNIYFNTRNLTPVTDHAHNRSDLTRVIFHTIEEELGGDRKNAFLRLSDIEDNTDLLNKIKEKMPSDDIEINKVDIRHQLRKIHNNTIEKLLFIEDTGDFATKAMEILSFIYEKSTARLHPFFHPYAEAFMNSLNAIANSLFSKIKFDETAGYFTFFRRYIMTCHVPFEGTPLRGVQILGFLETRNLKFEKVFFLDLNEGIVPDTKIEDSIVPFKAREILGLPTYRGREQLTAYYFDLLLQGAKEVHLFYVENDRKEKSRFIEKLLWERQKSEVKRQKSESRKVEDYLKGQGLIKSIQYKIKLENQEPESIYKTETMLKHLTGFVYSASSLDDYLRCPLMFYYGDVLKLKRKDELPGIIERTGIGIIVHRILRDYFNNKQGFVLSERDLDIGEMDYVVDRNFEEFYGKEIIGSIYLLKRQIKDRMKEFLQNYYIPLVRIEPVKILNIEKRFHHKINSFNLKGYVDKIETRGDRTYIVDYKTGYNENYLKINFKKLNPGKRETWPESIGSLQLPFYLLLYLTRVAQSSQKVIASSEATKQSHHPEIALPSDRNDRNDSNIHKPLRNSCSKDNYKRDINNLNGLFLLLGKAGISSDIELPLFDNYDIDERFKILEAIIFRLLDEILNPQQPFRATKKKREICPDCTFQYICGTKWLPH